MDRNIDKIICSCKGKCKEVSTTTLEDKKYGCGREGCCVNAFECNKCKTRFVFVFEAPEMG